MYIAPGNTGRPIYIEPTKMDEELPPPYPNCVNHYERTPTGMLPLVVNQENSTGLYESIPPLEVADAVATHGGKIPEEKQKCDDGDQEDDYEKLALHSNQSDVVRDGCYDNLQPHTDQTLPDSTVTIVSTKDTVSYTNLKDIQETEAPSYDSLEPVAIASTYPKPAETDEERVDPHYENTQKKTATYSNINEMKEKKRCNSMSW